MIFGYARVSTNEQDHALQTKALEAAGVDEIITDTMSGSKKDRPGLARLLDKAREGDTVIIYRLDRLGRSLINLVNLVEELDGKGIILKSLHESIDLSTANGRLQMHLFAALAEFERALLRERTRDGMAAAKAAGRVAGRKPALTDDQIAMAKTLEAAGHPKPEIAKQLGIGRSTLYRYLES